MAAMESGKGPTEPIESLHISKLDNRMNGSRHGIDTSINTDEKYQNMNEDEVSSLMKPEYTRGSSSYVSLTQYNTEAAQLYKDSASVLERDRHDTLTTSSDRSVFTVEDYSANDNAVIDTNSEVTSRDSISSNVPENMRGDNTLNECFLDELNESRLQALDLLNCSESPSISNVNTSNDKTVPINGTPSAVEPDLVHAPATINITVVSDVQISTVDSPSAEGSNASDAFTFETSRHRGDIPDGKINSPEPLSKNNTTIFDRNSRSDSILHIPNRLVIRIPSDRDVNQESKPSQGVSRGVLRTPSDREIGQHFGSIPTVDKDGKMVEEKVVDVEEVVVLKLLHQEQVQPRCHGGKYTGPMSKDGKMNGLGTYIWPNGDRYEGEFKDNFMSGQGKFISEAGWHYEGIFHDDKHGRGKFTWPSSHHSGVTFEGEFKNGKMHGYGKYTWADGSYYDGEFKDGKRHGFGLFIRSDGRVYEGDWMDDMRHGQGRYMWPDGDIYEGEWQDDKRNGYGTFEWKNGDIFEGEYVCNKRHGFGKHSCPNGDIYTGDWKNDYINGYGVSKWADGDQYEGYWLDNMKNGKGKYTWPDGHYYDGEWKLNKKHGQGIYRYVDGKLYEGLYREDKMHGYGKFTRKDGTVYDGYWNDGVYNSTQKS